MTKNLGIPCFVLTGFVLLSWSVAVGDDAGFGGGGHSPGGFTGSHVSGGFSSGVRVNSGSALSHSSGSFSGVAVNNAASSGGGHTNGGWPGGHANNGRLRPMDGYVTRYEARNFSGDGFAAHAGNDRTLSNVQRHSAGTNTFDHLHDFGHFRNSSLVIAPFGFPFPDWYSLYGWPDYGDYGNYDYGPGPDNYYDYGFGTSQ